MKESWYGDEAEFLGENIPLSEPLEGRSHEIVDTDPFLLGQLLEFPVDFRAKPYCPRDRLPWHQRFSVVQLALVGAYIIILCSSQFIWNTTQLGGYLMVDSSV